MITSEFLTPAVIWFLIGLGFFLLELVVPGLIIFFFGLGAWVTSLCCVLFEPGLNVQLLIFVVTSVVSLLLLRKSLKHRFFNANSDDADVLEDEFIGKTAIAEEAIEKGMRGKVHFKGTLWTVIPDSDIAVGDKVKIVNKDSLTLNITKC